MLTIFTHIPKTAGTSFFEQVIAPNYSEHEILTETSLTRFHSALKPHHKVVAGHRGYGMHRFTSEEYQYVTFLRNPIDRAVSAYHFILQCDPRYCQHSLYEQATRESITDFYRNPLFQNEMTQMLAGFEYGLLRKYTGLSLFSKQMLRQAKQNLQDRYLTFGIKERFDDSIELVRSKLGLERYLPTTHVFKKTKMRPSLSELTPDILDQLEDAHQLDLELYDFALTLFEKHLSGLDVDTRVSR
jgi:hypothetical protein